MANFGIAPVALGGRYQRLAPTRVALVAPSDTVPLGPCVQLIVSVAGNLVLGMWDGSTQTVAVVAGQTVVVSPKLVKAATTATVFLASN